MHISRSTWRHKTQYPLKSWQTGEVVNRPGLHTHFFDGGHLENALFNVGVGLVRVVASKKVYMEISAFYRQVVLLVVMNNSTGHPTLLGAKCSRKVVRGCVLLDVLSDVHV